MLEHLNTWPEAVLERFNSGSTVSPRSRFGPPIFQKKMRNIVQGPSGGKRRVPPEKIGGEAAGTGRAPWCSQAAGGGKDEDVDVLRGADNEIG